VTAGSHDNPPPPTPPGVPPAGTPAWYERLEALPRGRWRVRCFLDGTHPDGEVVDQPGNTSAMFTLWTASVDDDDHAVLWVNPRSVPDAEPMWFVVLEDRNAPEPTASLVGFATEHLPLGTVVTDPEFFHLPVPNRDQVAAVRWWTQTGAVDQVYVAERWRGRDQARLIVYAASAYHQHRGWPGRIHIDGRRTKAGQQALSARRHPTRVAPLEKLLAPMDAPAGTPAPSPDEVYEPPDGR
jgi:GNAT superfamily N-acetyltransferase